MPSVKHFSDDTSLFSIVHGINASRNALNNDLKKNVRMGIYVENAISRKTLKPAHPSIHFNDAQVAKGNVQKHLGLFLYEKFNFNYHVKEKLARDMKEINVIRKVSNVLPRHIVKSHLDYGNIVRKLKLCSVMLL